MFSRWTNSGRRKRQTGRSVSSSNHYNFVIRRISRAPFTRSRTEALFVLESAPIYRARSEIAQLALKNRLPTSFAFREYVEVGGLVAYGVNFSNMFRRAAEYIDKILKGTKPSDLPVEQPTK